MDIAFIDKLISLVERSSLVDLEYSENGARVRLTRTPPTEAVTPIPARDTASRAPAHIDAASPGAHTPAPAAAVAPLHTLYAGIVGTFYRASAPDQPPFVQLGDLVAEGQPLGLIDAMKMLNQVEADRAGRITAILAEDGAKVSGQTPLFQIAAAEQANV
jgi:acetyl-CoA carboxylase biotin carboxyl carrier protein